MNLVEYVTTAQVQPGLPGGITDIVASSPRVAKLSFEKSTHVPYNLRLSMMHDAAQLGIEQSTADNA